MDINFKSKIHKTSYGSTSNYVNSCSNVETRNIFAIVRKFHGGSIDLSNVYLFLYQKASDNVGDGDEAHMGEILELDVLEELQKTSDRDSPEAVERPVANHVLPNT